MTEGVDVGIFGSGRCGYCDCSRFRGADRFPYVPNPYEQSIGMKVPDNIDPVRDSIMCECGHGRDGHAPSWFRRPLLRLWPGGPVLLSRWALLLVPVAVALASGLTVDRHQGGQTTPLGGDTLRTVRVAVAVAIVGFASPPIRKVYGLLGLFIKIAIVGLVVYIIALMGVQEHWWGPFSVGPVHVG